MTFWKHCLSSNKLLTNYSLHIRGFYCINTSRKSRNIQCKEFPIHFPAQYQLSKDIINSNIKRWIPGLFDIQLHLLYGLRTKK